MHSGLVYNSVIIRMHTISTVRLVFFHLLLLADPLANLLPPALILNVTFEKVFKWPSCTLPEGSLLCRKRFLLAHPKCTVLVISFVVQIYSQTNKKQVPCSFGIVAVIFSQ